MKIEINHSKTNKIAEWDKFQLVINPEGDTVVLTNGIHQNDTFEGTLIYGMRHHCGHFKENWQKRDFGPLDEEVKIILQNT